MFVYTYNGNMARAVQGHRRFEGFLKTINPDWYYLTNNKYAISCNNKYAICSFIFCLKFEIFSIMSQEKDCPYERRSEDGPKFEEYFYSNPQPECLCSNGTRGDDRDLERFETRTSP
ncbi:hypothetical protein ACMD2_21634 [Ananas comosus]|uniref:Uncharacterized protein n=1 Tax=Ananas comosus TaxID=4615 RepID=A0A199UK61_ANACO|nr:hypothetical protein ACMD2_21634 [Ananas comosus]